MKTEKILVVGDIHGCYGYLNSIISKKNPLTKLGILFGLLKPS